MIHPIEYRYGSDEMRRVFSREGWVRYAVKVEFAALKAVSRLGIADISDRDIQEAFEKAVDVTYEDVARYEKIYKHEVFGLVWALYEVIDKRVGKYLHFGLTSNDVLDNVMMMQVRDGLNILLEKLHLLLELMKDFVEKNMDTPVLGRTHGQAATPLTLGFRFNLYLRELSRAVAALEDSKKYVVGKVGGAVGTGVETYPSNVEFEELVLAELGLDRADGYLQILPRDLLAHILSRLIMLSSVLEHIANEIRILSRTGIEEVREGFGESQVGSSVMPHKRNPIKSEKVCGIARYLRSLLPSIYENIVFEDERDLRNSSFERTVVPEVFILVDEQVESMLDIIRGVVVDVERCIVNIEDAGLNVYSNILLHEAVKRGGDRQVIHERLRKLFSRRFTDVDDLKKAVREDPILSNYIDEETVENAVSLERCVDAARAKFKSFPSL